MSERRVDVVVVGAGTAGANAAYQLARRGRSVVLLERRPAAAGGAQWHNGILDWQLEAAGLEPSRPPERVAERRTTHLVGPDGSRGPSVADGPVVEADMARLGARLRALALDAGVEVVDEVGAVEVELAGGRPVAVGTARGRFAASLLVDASGRAGVVRSAVPALAEACPPAGGAELCATSDSTLRIADRDGAKRFLERHGADAGDAVTMVGCNGGWSTRAITVSEDLETVALLVGCVATGTYGNPARMEAEAGAAEPWMGEAHERAAGLIPLRRPYARLGAPGVALVGDAGCQVFPAHGSGIGIGLIAGRLLADAVAEHDDPGADGAVAAYQEDFHRAHGGVLAAYDAVRRMSTALGEDGVAGMVRAGVLDEASSRAGLDQRWPALSVPQLARRGSRLARHPGLAARIVPWLVRAQVAHALAPRHPRATDQAAVARWDARLARVLGPLPT